MRKVIGIGVVALTCICVFGSSAPAADADQSNHHPTLSCRHKGERCTTAQECCSTACYQGGDKVAHCQ